MESIILNRHAFSSDEGDHDLQTILCGHVLHHHFEVASLRQDVTNDFQSLSLGDVCAAHQQVVPALH
jgi:hypothetical protein